MQRLVNWSGSFSAIVTPFHRSGELDEVGLRANVRMTVEEGAHGLVIAGHNGEAHLMTDDERLRVIEVAVSEVNRRIPVIAGTGSIRTESVIRLSGHAASLGVDGVMIEAPYFMTPKPADLVAHFADISAAVSVPIMVYNNPARAGVDLDVSLMREIAKNANVVAIKETSASFERVMRLIVGLGDRLRVFVGPSRLFGLAAAQLGAAGFVDGMSQIVGRGAAQLFEYARMPERLNSAIELQRDLFLLGELLFHSPGTSPATIKDAMRLLGRPGGYPRPPLRPMSGPDLRRLDLEMRNLAVVRRIAEQHSPPHLAA
jgi:4-hydroxy-tetrahydrodipicolinate synthase